jgi:hypothetical protein
MPDITVTEQQLTELQEIQSDLEAAYVDTYGHVRMADVISYFIDTYVSPEQEAVVAEQYEVIATAEYPLLQQAAADTEGVPGSGIDTETMRGMLVSTLGVSDLAAKLQSLSEPDEPEGQVEQDKSRSADATPGPDADNTDGILATANRLLDEHTDKWDETDGSEEPYTVRLPDGETERVRTKDDVRQLLFKHY